LALSPLQVFFRKARELKAANPNIISLAVGEPTSPTPLVVKNAGIAAIRSNRTRYTPAGGTMELRSKAAEDFQKNGIPATSQNTIISAGSQPLIAAAMLATTDPGDTVIVPTPYYPPFVTLARLFGLNIIHLDTSNDNFQLKNDVIKNVISGREKKVILLFNSPNNPTGVVWNPKELLNLPGNVYIIADEAYQRIYYGQDRFVSAASLPELADRTITIRSCSKSFNMSGWRIGYLTGPQEVAEKIEIILEAMMVSACSISQEAALAAFDKTEKAIARNLQDLSRRRNAVVRWLKKRSLTFPNPQGAFYVFANLPERIGVTSATLAEMILEKADVVITPGIAFGNDKYVRMSYACAASLAKLKEALARIEKTLSF
jgi:aspartate/methionine/tyrosine aminotransferase